MGLKDYSGIEKILTYWKVHVSDSVKSNIYIISLSQVTRTSCTDERRSQTLVRGSNSPPLTHSTAGYQSILVDTTLHKERHDHEMSCWK